MNSSYPGKQTPHWASPVLEHRRCVSLFR